MALLAQHHALLVSTPEYNGGYPALLKNALDWASRPSERHPTGIEVLSGKVGAMISPSPGILGGMRAQIALQISLHKLGLLVIPNLPSLGLALHAFDEQQLLKDANADEAIRAVGVALVATATSLTPKAEPRRVRLQPFSKVRRPHWAKPVVLFKPVFKDELLSDET
jgi:chromate reductase, NAD(P)H dehydrogenase (quinone)